MKYSLFLLLGGLLLSAGSPSNSEKQKQQAIEALKRCSGLYLELKKFSIDVEYSIFYNTSDFKYPADSEMGVLIRKNENFYKKDFGNISILNERYHLKVDTQSEIMVIREKSKTEGIPDQVNYDSLVTCIESVEKIEQGYRYYLNLPHFSKMDVLYSSEGYLHTLRNYYRKPMDFGEGEVMVVSQIRYTNFSRNPKIESNLFSEKNYLTIDSEGSIHPAEKYNRFQILNFLDKPEGY